MTGTVAPFPVLGRESPEAPPAPSRIERIGGAPRRNAALVGARISLAVGVLIALFVLYELVVSGLVEQRTQAELLTTFQQQIQTTTLDSPSAPLPAGGPVALLSIPAIGVSQVVVEGTTPALLKSGPGHLAGTPLPGEYGNAVIEAHRTTYGAPFAHLGNLTSGDVVTVTTGQGVFSYRVGTVERVNQGQADPLVGTPDSRLTLVTSDPQYLATGRLVVIGHLVGRPIAIATRPPVFAGTADFGLAGDPMGLALGVVAIELFALAVWAAFRMRGRWPPVVIYLITAPVLLALALAAFSTFDLLLPGTI